MTGSDFFGIFTAFIIALPILILHGSLVRKKERKEIAARLVERAESRLLSDHPFFADETLDCINCVVTQKERLGLEKFLGARDHGKCHKIHYFLNTAEQKGADGKPLFSDQELARAMRCVYEEKRSYREDWNEEFNRIQALVEVVENRKKETPPKKPEE